MADIKLFNIKGKVEEYQSGTVTLEKELQNVIENNKIEKWDGKLPYATGGSAILDVSADGNGDSSEN